MRLSNIFAVTVGVVLILNAGCSKPPAPEPVSSADEVSPAESPKSDVTKKLPAPKRMAKNVLHATDEAKLIKKMCERYQARRALGMNIDVHKEIYRDSGTSSHDMNYEIMFERPNRLRFIATGKYNLSIFSDGEMATFYSPNTKLYEKHEALGDFDFNNTGGESLRFITRLQQTNLAALFSSNPYRSYMKDVVSIRTNLTDTKNDTTQIELFGVNWTIILEIKNPKTEPKLVSTTLNVISSGKLVMRVVAKSKITEQDKLNARNLFSFVPPEGAVFKSALGLNNRYAPLYGKVAPEFDVKLFKSGRIQSRQFKNKILVISFWTGVNNIASGYIEKLFALINPLKAKKVFFLAVNATEKEAALSDWLDKIKISPLIAMDTDGRVRDIFKVTRMPITLIIGRTGVVEAAHLSHSPKEMAKIEDEIERLMRGESLLKK